MTAKKVSELTALTTPAAEDLLMIVDDPSVDPASKKITFANLTKTISSNLISSNTINANTFVGNNFVKVGVAGNNTEIATTYVKIQSASSNTTINATSVSTTNFSGNGANISSINATNISTGTLNTARLPATANISTAINVGANVTVNTSTILVKNGSVNTTITAAQATFGANVQINGELIVSGAITVLDTPELWINDTDVLLNADLPSDVAPTDNCGFTIERGSANNVSLIWNETTDKWQISNTLQSYSNIAVETYSAATPSDWSAPAPTTISAAIDRLATLVKTLNGGTGA